MERKGRVVSKEYRKQLRERGNLPHNSFLDRDKGILFFKALFEKCMLLFLILGMTKLLDPPC